MSSKVRRAAAIVAIVVVALSVVVVLRGPLSRAATAALLDALTGDRFAFSRLWVGSAKLVARGVVVTSAAGEPIATADALDVAYRFADLLPGSGHRYGISAIRIDAPHAILVRRPDGSFDVPFGGGGGGAAPGAASHATPLRCTIAIRDGSIELIDDARKIAIARDLSVSSIALDASLDSARSSTYALRANVGGFREQALSLRGRVDAGGFAVHRLRARAIALAPLVDYLINTRSAAVAQGVARDVDLRAYTFGDATGPLGGYHLTGTARLDDGEIRIPGLVVPATAMRGPIDVYDDGFVTPHLRATIGGIPVRVEGGLFGWRALAFRLGVVTDTRLETLRGLFAFSNRLPLHGPAHVETLLESAVGSPLVATAIRAASVSYANIPIQDVSGRAIYDANAVDVVGARGTYGGLDASVEGAIALHDAGPHTTLVVDANGNADRVPYAAEIAAHAHLAAIALLDGDGIRIDARGVATGASPGVSLAGAFHVDPSGEGAFGPVHVSRAAGGDAAGTFYLNRRASESAFWADAHDFPFARVAADPRLPGLALAPPVFGGRLDGAFAGDGPPSNFRIAGVVRARDLTVGAVRVADVRANAAGTFGEVHLGGIRATASWGAFDGSGAYRDGRLALEGRYRGSFERLAAFTGNVGARGSVNGPIALLLGPQSSIVQVRGARSSGGTVRGVPVDAIAGTIAVRARSLRVYAATARVAGGTFAASGRGDGAGGIGVSVASARVARLRALVPLGNGMASAIGRVSLRGDATRFDGGVAVGDASLDRLPLAADGDVSLAGTRLDLRAADGYLGPVTAGVAGSLAHLGRSPRYDLALRLDAVPIGPLARAIAPGRGDVAGILDGNVTVRGTAATLATAGTIDVPEGIVNGLAFTAMRFGFTIDPGGLAVHAGRVTVGSTRIVYGARFAGNDAAVRVTAGAADLANFNDYFDDGDTLGGTGAIDVRFRKRGGTVRTRADVAIASLRYRRYDLGDARAQWISSGRDVRGSIAFGGVSGRLDTAGTLTLPAHAPLDQLLVRSRFAGTANVRDLDLGVWLPALGYRVPIGGRVDGQATIAGLLRDPDVKTTASLVDGTLGDFPVDRLEIAATSTLRRTTVTRAVLELPSIAIAGTGQFGFGARDPIAFSLHAKSPDVGPLAARLFAGKIPLVGAAEADVKIDGTRGKPHAIGGFDLENATYHGVAIPRALGELSVSGRDVVLSDAEVQFAKGGLYFAGSVPLEVTPFGFGPASAAITLDFNAKGVDMSDFAPLLPSASTLAGTLDGHVVVGGTAGNPRLDGAVALTGGSFRAPFEATPLEHVSARATFADRTASLDALHADAGGGTLDATGRIVFANLVHPGTDAPYEVNAIARALTLDVPEFVSGRVDGTLSLTHVPADRPTLSAKLALDDAVIPFSALLLADSGTGGGFDAAPVVAPVVPGSGGDVTLALDLSAGHNVRVRSANVDLGAKGTIAVSGSRADPILAGTFTSTGGTLSYFNTVFRVLDGTVTFEPDLGVIPNLDAHAVTHVQDPDPNTVRNVSGTADVTLDVHGPVTNLSIGLSSDPAYDRQQILGLLLSAPALGASTLFADRATATPFGSTTATPATDTIAGAKLSSTEATVAQEAFGIANAQFTRTLLSPIETSVAGAIGLTNINVNVDPTGNVGLTARKILGKKVNAIYGTSFGYPYRQTFGFEIKPSARTAAQVTVFQTLGAYGVDSLTPTTYIAPISKVQAAQPTQGTAGFSISLQRLF